MTARIIGTGSALPNRVITNDDLAKIVDTSDEWISSRTGIRSRHISDAEETAAVLAARAGQKAIENSGIQKDEVEMILVATCSAEDYFPNLGCQVQNMLGMEHTVGMDLNAACSGFLFSLNTAFAYIKAGIYKTILVIGTETLSKIVNWKDRSTCVLFGDGAGACVIRAEETGVLDFVQHSDGSMGHVLTAKASSTETPVQPETGADPIYMDGQAVFKFAVKKVQECIEEILERNHLDKEEVSCFILHQANKRIIQSVAKRLKLSEEKFPVNLEGHGNTSAASIPLLLDDLNREGRLHKGDKLILSGFGAGLTWGATLLEW